MKYVDYKAVYIDKTMTLQDWTAVRENAKINLSVAGIAGSGAFDPRSLITPNLPVKSRLFVEFQNYWAENYNVKVSDELAGLNFRTVKNAADGIEYVLKEFPAAAQCITEFKITTVEGHVMNTSYNGEIGFNPNYFNSFTSFNNKTIEWVKSLMHPKNTKIFHYGAHEAGHILEIALIKKYGGGTIAWRDCIQSRRIVQSVFAKIEKTPDTRIFELRRAISKSIVKKGVSINETLAEAVMDYVANKKDASLLSVKIWEVLEEELK